MFSQPAWALVKGRFQYLYTLFCELCSANHWTESTFSKGRWSGNTTKTNKHPELTLPWLNKSWVMLNEVISSGDFCRSGWFLFLQEKSHRDNGNCSFANGLINTPTGRYCCEGNDSEITKPTIDLIWANLPPGVDGRRKTWDSWLLS